MILSAIVAMAQNRVIGKQGGLPWELPEDLKRFKQVTIGHPIIMGRKTFESLGRLLPGREHVIISRQPNYRVPGATVVSSVDEAIRSCEGRSDEAFFIGGAEIYRAALPKIQRLYLTLIHQNWEGDVYFPEFDPTQFREISRENRVEPFLFSFLVLEK